MLHKLSLADVRLGTPCPADGTARKTCVIVWTPCTRASRALRADWTIWAEGRAAPIAHLRFKIEDEEWRTGKPKTGQYGASKRSLQQFREVPAWFDGLVHGPAIDDERVTRSPPVRLPGTF